MQIEAAQHANEDLLGGFLDYEKLFDQFHPDLVKGLLDEAGFPKGLTCQLHYLYTNLKRYVQIAGS